MCIFILLMEELFYYLNSHALNIFIDGRVIIILKKTYSYSILLMVELLLSQKTYSYFILLMVEFLLF